MNRLTRHRSARFVSVDIAPTAVLVFVMTWWPSAAAQAAAIGIGEGNLAATIDTTGYLNQLYLWMLAFVGIAALFAIVMGGVMYMFSGTSLTKVDSAKRWIWNAVFGIIIAAGGVLLLSIINPDLVTHGFDLTKVIDDACQKYGNGCAVGKP